MLDLSRSALLACWGAGVLSGHLSAERAVRAICRDDEPHRVAVEASAAEILGAGLNGADLVGAGLDGLLQALRGWSTGGLRLVQPVPGDVLGLPGPAEVNQAALEAGECVLTRPPGPALALVPEVTAFGSVYEPGAWVTWRVHAVADRPIGDPGDLAEAELLLREALRKATDELDTLDVARWRPDAAGRISQVRAGGIPGGVVPPGAPPRALRVLELAARVQAIVALATQDDGAAVTGWETQQRTQALRGLDHVSRRAVVAAVNAIPSVSAAASGRARPSVRRSRPS